MDIRYCVGLGNERGRAVTRKFVGNSRSSYVLRLTSLRIRENKRADCTIRGVSCSLCAEHFVWPVCCVSVMTWPFGSVFFMAMRQRGSLPMHPLLFQRVFHFYRLPLSARFELVSVPLCTPLRTLAVRNFPARRVHTVANRISLLSRAE